jgi:RimJ/RimL family protein N-acetyltransferase
MEIETKRLHLREFKTSDWQEILAYQSDPHYQRFYALTERTPQQAQEFVRTFIDQQQEQPRQKYQLAITLKTSSSLIGTCGIRMDQSRTHQADLGYELSPKYWGKGYATESAQAMLHFGFTTLHLHRIWSWCISENRASTRVLERLGMQLEGRLRENEWFKNQWWDTLIYGILESEWKEQLQKRT